MVVVPEQLNVEVLYCLPSLKSFFHNVLGYFEDILGFLLSVLGVYIANKGVIRKPYPFAHQ